MAPGFLRPGRSLLAGAVTLGVMLGGEAARADRAFDVAMAPTTFDSYGMMVVERAKTPGKFEFGTSTVFSWAKNPFRPTLSDQNNGLTDSQFDLIQHQLTVDLGFYLGLADFLSIAAVMPMGVNLYDLNPVGTPEEPQAPSAANPAGTPRATGIYANQPRQTVPISGAGARDPRFAVKARFYGGRYFEIGTLLELTVLPLRQGRQDIADQYEILLTHFPNLELVPLSRVILLEAASLRATQGLRTPDAIHVATAVISGASAIVTNDASWRRLGSIPVVTLLQNA